MKSIIVYMSTYNGERYIKEQIDSILNQNNVSVSLVIRDDGSKDNTIAILEEYSRKYANIYVNYGENLGYSNSFMTLLQDSLVADYYAFADQDDVWKPDKMYRAICKLKDKEYSVYASSLIIVNEKLEVTGIKNFPGYTPTFGSTLSRNRLAGCTMVFDNKLKTTLQKNSNEIISANKYKYGHDGWVLLFCFLNNGTVVLDSESYIYYRRHNSTVTNISGGFVKRIKNECKNYFSRSNWRQDTVAFLMTREHRNLNLDVFMDLVRTYRSDVGKRIKLAFKKDINTGIKVVDLLNRIAILAGRY